MKFEKLFRSLSGGLGREKIEYCPLDAIFVHADHKPRVGVIWQQLVRVCALECQEEAKQLSETTIVVVALWAVAIAFNPFRMLPEERVVHIALQRDIRRSLNRESGKRGRVHCLEPDIIAPRNWIENPFPAAV